MGKAYANRKTKEERPEGDFYPTPKALIFELVKTGELNRKKKILDPSCGTGVIAYMLKLLCFSDVEEHDLYVDGVDFLETSGKVPQIVTNPPFSLFDDFVRKAKERATKKIIFIGRLNFFGTADRWASGIWDELKTVYVFNRMVDYRTPLREDGTFNVGALVTGWFVWERGWRKPPMIKSIDVNKYVRQVPLDETTKKIPS